jgi:hypothetical protein
LIQQATKKSSKFSWGRIFKGLKNGIPENTSKEQKKAVPENPE